MKGGIGTWLCWINHKWQSKRIQRIETVRIVRRCLRCGWLEIDKEPTIPMGHTIEQGDLYRKAA